MPQPPLDAPVSTLVTGDRLCTGCGYNLIGQPVVREPDLGLLIARCPECGTPVAVQHYPVLGRWPARLRLVAALAWVLLVLSAIGFAGGMAAAPALSVADAHRWRMGEVIDELHRADHPDLAEQGFGPLMRNFPSWHAGFEPGVLRTTVTERLARTSFTPAQLVSVGAGFLLPGLLAGVLVALVVPHQRGVRLAAVAAAGPVAALGLLLLAVRMNRPAGTPSNHWEAAEAMVGWGSSAIAGGIATVVIVTGALAGRPIARAIIRMSLPPRHRGPFAGLWLVDGKPVPGGASPRPASRTRDQS